MKNPGIRACDLQHVALVLAALISLALPAMLQAQFTFTTNNGAITITRYTGSGGAVVIPSVTNGYPVTAIGTNVFRSQTNLTSVTIPDSVTSICYNAFYTCSSLTSVTIPDSVTSIEGFPFANCHGLTNISVATGNQAYVSISGVWFDKLQTTLIGFPDGLTASYAIPNSVTNIGEEAFEGCLGLTNVTIPNNVVTIGDNAFRFCYGLTRVTIPDSVTRIGNYAFYWCTGLASLTIGNNVTTIGNNAFNFCELLGKVKIGNSVTSIGNFAFKNCTYLTNLTIGNNVTNIGAYAFWQCDYLTTAYFLGNAPSVNSGPGSADTTVFQDDAYGQLGMVFYLPGTTGWGSTFGGWHTHLWYQPNPMIMGSGYGLGATSNGFAFTISWATNVPVVVEVCTNLANPVWKPVTTNALVNGTNHFSDPDWTNYPGRFYRVRSP